MFVYLRGKFEVSRIIRQCSFRQWGVFLLQPTLTSKRTPKKPIEIRVNTPEFSRDFMILIISSISSFEMTKMIPLTALTIPFPLIFI